VSNIFDTAIQGNRIFRTSPLFSCCHKPASFLWITGEILFERKQQRREHGPPNYEERASMKTMTCKDLGGICDQKVSAESWNEMVGLMVKHVTENHPDVAKQMEQMHNEDPKKWGRETKPRWEATPED
jgi:predicted small metal-binding protein